MTQSMAIDKDTLTKVIDLRKKYQAAKDIADLHTFKKVATHLEIEAEKIKDHGFKYKGSTSDILTWDDFTFE